MNGTRKTILVIAGVLSAILIVSQLVMGQIILGGGNDAAQWIKRHQHSGYLTVAVSLLYIVGSLATIASIPRRHPTKSDTQGSSTNPR